MMNGMSPEARAVLNASRRAVCPTEGDRARVLAAVKGTATLAGGVATVAVARSSWGAVRELWRTASLSRMLAASVPFAAGAVYAWQVVTSPPSSDVAASAVARLSAVAPPTSHHPEPLKLSEPGPHDEPEPEPSPPPSAHVVKRPPTAASLAPPLDSFREEVALLTRAQAELSQGRAPLALEALSEHARRFPRGSLTEERLATRARVLCALGRRREAEAELERVERRNPTSPYAVRAREACQAR